MLEVTEGQFQVHVYQNQSEVTDRPPLPPTGWAVYCEAWPMRWWERVLVFFHLRQRPYYTIPVPGLDGWSLSLVVSGTGAIYMARGMVKPKSGIVTPLWEAPIKVTE